MLDYPLLEALAAVVREGNFERAGHVLRLTPSAISQRIKLLEQRVGAVLVVRGQPCRATPMGGLLCRHLELVGQLEATLKQQLPSGDEETFSMVSVAVNADSLATWFLEAVAQFRAKRVQFDIIVDDQDHTAERLRSGSVQAAVTTMESPVTGCVVHPLRALRYAATCSPEFKDQYFAQGVTADSLQRAPCLIYNRKDNLQNKFIRRVTGRDLYPPRHVLPSVDGFHQASRLGLAWGLNPERLVREDLREGRLVEIAPECRVSLELFWQVFRLAPPIVEELTKVVVSVAQEALE